MGSSVVILLEPTRIDLADIAVHDPSKVPYGEKLVSGL
jgi:hypothetical protein